MRELSNKSFREYCRKYVSRINEYQKKQGLVNREGKPDKNLMEKISTVPQQRWNPQMRNLVANAPLMATTLEYLGDLELAKIYSQLSSHRWNLDEMDLPTLPKNDHPELDPYLLDFFWKDNRVEMQLESAISNDRIERRERANQLYKWVAELRNISDEEYDKFISGFSGPKHHYEVWGRKTQRTYALVCLERWEEAMAEAEGARKWIERDTRPRGDHAWRDHFWLLQSLWPLIEYKLEPTEKKKEVAKKGLKPGILRSEDHSRTLFLLFYLYNLRGKYPELI